MQAWYIPMLSLIWKKVWPLLVIFCNLVESWYEYNAACICQIVIWKMVFFTLLSLLKFSVFGLDFGLPKLRRSQCEKWKSWLRIEQSLAISQYEKYHFTYNNLTYACRIIYISTFDKVTKCNNELSHYFSKPIPLCLYKYVLVLLYCLEIYGWGKETPKIQEIR